MQSGETVEVLTITHVKKLAHSVNGNPRYRIGFSGGLVATSRSDAGWCYAVGNPGMGVGATVLVTFTRAGRIAQMEPWSGEPAGKLDIPDVVLLAGFRAAVAATGSWVKSDPERAEEIVLAMMNGTGGISAGPIGVSGQLSAAMAAAIEAWDAYQNRRRNRS